jgi:xanthine dehydrogenase accessory factor
MNGGHASRLPEDWVATLIEMLRRDLMVVRVVVAETRGSTPREAGACMLIGESVCVGTIGGGRLEWELIAAAHELLADESTAARVRKSVLGTDFGQCCGGVVSTWLERFTRADLDLLRAATDACTKGPAILVSTLERGQVQRRLLCAPDESAQGLRAPMVLAGNASGRLILRERLDAQFPAVWLYGAGHVGRAVAGLLLELPLRVTWIDSRPQLRDTPGVRYEPDPVASVAEAPSGTYFLVMTHSHPLDFRLCHEVLKRNDFAWLGLIGSASKSARFRSHLRRVGVHDDAVARLVCPIGIEGIRGKWPAIIAVAVAAQIMREVCAAAAPSSAHGAFRLDPCIGHDCPTCGLGNAKVTP